MIGAIVVIVFVLKLVGLFSESALLVVRSDGFERGERSGLLTRVATTESGSVCEDES